MGKKPTAGLPAGPDPEAKHTSTGAEPTEAEIRRF